ncbi:MAG: hypothetical protein WC934_06275 [Acidithiobacillus sp.]|jgi:hypothetical protein|uniref:hypothetical protein n=1 Tax=Acidithiobacillus sp. TaxID=1872118 RepID=UPI00355E54AE
MNENINEPKRYKCPLVGCGDRLFICSEQMDMFDCASDHSLDIKKYLEENHACICEHGKRCLVEWLIEINVGSPEGYFTSCTDPTCKTMLDWGEKHFKNWSELKQDFGVEP